VLKYTVYFTLPLLETLAFNNYNNYKVISVLTPTTYKNKTGHFFKQQLLCKANAYHPIPY